MKKEAQICHHEELEKINNLLYICKNCSILGFIKEITPNETKIRALTKPPYYIIKNEINILDITKNTINFYMNKPEKNGIIKDEKSIPYLNRELYLKFRNKIIKHIYNLCRGIKSTYECYYLSICLLDNIINNLYFIINNYQLDLLCTSCFIISKKFIEIDKLKKEYYDQYLTICHSPQKFINSHDLVIAEIECLKILKYNLNIPTSLTILKYIFICGIIYSDEIDINGIDKIYDECLKILNFCVEQNEFYVNYNPIQIVFGIIYLVRKKFNLAENIMKNYYNLFDFKFSFIKDCVQLISKLYYKENYNIQLDSLNNRDNNIIDNKDMISINKKYFSQKKYTNKNKSHINLSPIIKKKRNYSNNINLESKSNDNLINLNIDDIDKKNEEYNLIIIKNDMFKTKKNSKKNHFFRCNQKKGKIDIIDIKNYSYFSYPSNKIDFNLYIEKGKNYSKF